jgi:hypothetical protein
MAEASRQRPQASVEAEELVCFGPPAWNTGNTICNKEFCVPRRMDMDLASGAPEVRASATGLMLSARNSQVWIQLAFDPGPLEHPTSQVLRDRFRYASGRLYFPSQSAQGSLARWDLPAVRDLSAFKSFDVKEGWLRASLPLAVSRIHQYNEPFDCPADVPCGCGFDTDFSVTVHIALRLRS